MTMYTYPCTRCGEVAYDIRIHRMGGCHKRNVTIDKVAVGDRPWSRSGPFGEVVSVDTDGDTYEVTTTHGVISGTATVVVSLWAD